MKLEDMPEMQQKDVLNLYDLGVQLTTAEIDVNMYVNSFNRYLYSYDLTQNDLCIQLQQAKIYRLRGLTR